MSNSTGVEWLNENEYRGYPLTSDSTRYFIVNNITYDMYPMILDAMLVYPSLPNSVEILSFQSSGTDLTIAVTGTTFVIPNYLSATYPQYIRDSNSNLLVIGSAVKTLPINTLFPISNALFEASVVYEILPTNLGLASLTIGTFNLTGDITLNQGYQLSLIPGDTIDIEVGRSEGIPITCGGYLNITNDCFNIINSINGITPNKSGDAIKFVAGEHVVIIDDPDNNRIYIGYDFSPQDITDQPVMRPPATL